MRLILIRSSPEKVNWGILFLAFTRIGQIRRERERERETACVGAISLAYCLSVLIPGIARKLRLAQKKARHEALMVRVPERRGALFSHTPPPPPPPNPWLHLLSAPPMRCIPAPRGHACVLLPLLLLCVVRGRLLLVFNFGWTCGAPREKARPSARSARLGSGVSFFFLYAFLC